MSAVPLRLARSRTSAPACAWIIPGGDASTWLDQIAALRLPAHGVRLFVVPRSAADVSAGALLVVPIAASAEGSSTGRAMPLSRRGARLLIPADSRLWPPVEDQELDALLPLGLHLMHPVFGMVRYAEEDALQVSDLVRPQARRDARWDAANPGVRQPRLRGVHAETTPSAEAVLAAGKADTSTKSLDTLPAGPGEPRRTTADRLRSWIARRTLRLTKHVPRSATSPTWINRAENWASSRVAADIERMRAREIERLLHLLRVDPDIGLRFALPIAGATTRGVARPSGELPPRATEFDARRLGGGTPGDRWDLRPETTRDLTTLYRSQAERLSRLGQHRRVAYVLANLLGDLRGAATALEAGRHWREAAALYRERLKDPAASAYCLERGGLLTEAIVAYIEIGDRLRAATLLDRVGRRPEAERLWREVVAERRQSRDRVGAAALLADELRSPDEALQTLDDGWPAGHQSDERLRASLDLLGRLGRGDDACKWVRRARQANAVTSVHVLAAAAMSHPDANCRAEAADTVRVLVGTVLAAERGTDAKLLTAVIATDRGDRLLARDATRFGAAAKSSSGPAARSPSGYQVVGEFVLPELHPEAFAIVPTREGLLVCGVCEPGSGVELHFLTWLGRPRTARLRWEVAAPRHAPRLRVNELTRRVVIAFPGGAPRLFSQEFVGAGGHGWRALTPSWIPDGVREMCAGAAHSIWTFTELSEGSGILAACHGAQGLVVRSAEIRGTEHLAIVSAASVDQMLFIAARTLIRVDSKGNVSDMRATLADPESLPIPESLAVTPRHLPRALLLSGENGCELWTRLQDAVPTHQLLTSETARSRACFLNDGRIVVLDEGRVRLFRIDGARPRCVADQLAFRGRSIVAVFPGPHEREVAVVTTSGASDPRARVTKLRFAISS